MNDQETDNLTPLDRMVAQEQLQMLKAAIPYLNPAARPALSIFAKAAELSHTIRLFSRPAPLRAMSAEEPPGSGPADMIRDISRFASGETRENLEGILTAMSTLSMMQNCKEEFHEPEL